MDFIHNFDLISWSIIGFPWAMGGNCKQGCQVYRSQENPQQYMCTYLLLQGVQQYCLLLFSLTAPLSIEDFSGGVQMHLGSAHRHFESCYAGFGHVMHKLVAITSPNHAQHASKVPRANKEGTKKAGSTKVQPCNLCAHIMLGQNLPWLVKSRASQSGRNVWPSWSDEESAFTIEGSMSPPKLGCPLISIAFPCMPKTWSC
jgi:hypothetical protein